MKPKVVTLHALPTEPVIEKGIPIARQSGRPTANPWPFAKLGVGDSFAAPLETVKRLKSAACYWKQTHPGWNYTVRALATEARIWRLAGILAALLFATPALAWTNTNNGHNNQIVDGGPGAQANQHQRQTATGGTGGAATATGGHAAATGGTAGASVAVSGIGGGGGRSGPTVFVPDGTGQAPCGGGLGAGAGASSAGAAAGGTLWEFGDCKRMRESAALRSLAVETGDARLQQAALNELCQIDRIRDAFGGQCPVLGQRMPDVSVHSYPYDWCATRNAGDRSQHLECDRVRTKDRRE